MWPGGPCSSDARHVCSSVRPHVGPGRLTSRKTLAQHMLDDANPTSPFCIIRGLRAQFTTHKPTIPPPPPPPISYVGVVGRGSHRWRFRFKSTVSKADRSFCQQPLRRRRPRLGVAQCYPATHAQARKSQASNAYAEISTLSRRWSTSGVPE